MPASVSSPSVPFVGVPIFLNGREYLVPSLSLRQVQRNEALLTERFAPIGEGNSLSQHFERYTPMILAAIQRNYPEVTLDNLYDWLDMATFKDAYLAVQAASGFEVKKPGE